MTALFWSTEEKENKHQPNFIKCWEKLHNQGTRSHSLSDITLFHCDTPPLCSSPEMTFDAKELSVKYMGQLSTTLVLILPPHHDRIRKLRNIPSPNFAKAPVIRPLLRHIWPLSLLSHLWRHILSHLWHIWTPFALTHLLSHILRGFVVSGSSVSYMFICEIWRYFNLIWYIVSPLYLFIGPKKETQTQTGVNKKQFGYRNPKRLEF